MFNNRHDRQQSSHSQRTRKRDQSRALQRRRLSAGIESLEQRRVMAGLQDVVYQGDVLAKVGSSPSNFVQVGSEIFFTAATADVGNELWKTDGTAAGTLLVKDLTPGPTGSNISDLTNFDGKLYFRAGDGESDFDLWKSDGTAVGTVLVKDFAPQNPSFFFGDLTVFNGSLFFRATDGVDGVELWKTDGTTVGTVQVKDINPGTESSFPADMKVVGNKMFFRAIGGSGGFALWCTDGTEAGTQHLNSAAIYNGGDDNFAALGGNLIFSAENDYYQRELWKSDGTPEGTVKFSDGNASGLTVVGNQVYFARFTANGYQLWRTDGTELGTLQVPNVTVEPNSIYYPVFCQLNGVSYFRGNDGFSGMELWRTDGTDAGTKLVKDIRPGNLGSNVRNLVDVNGTLFFTADDGVNGMELWKSDGTTAGTVLVKNLMPAGRSSSPMNLANIGGVLYFQAGTIDGFELWKSDGTSAGTVMVKDIQPDNDQPTYAASINDKLLFVTSASNFKLADANGTITALPTTLRAANLYRPEYVEINGVLYFSAYTYEAGAELWRTDGTVQGTWLVKDINPGTGYNDKLGSTIAHLTDVNGTLFFTADDGVHGDELWKSDGTAAGTILVADLAAGAASSDPRSLVNVGGTLYFAANDGSSGYELWRSDGTSAGTSPVKDINAAGSSLPQDLVSFNGALFFDADDGIHGRELWTSDGTSNGTQLVADIQTGSGGSRLGQFQQFGAAFYFSADDGVHGSELWKTDGTTAGTMLVADIRSGSLGSDIGPLTVVDDTFYFRANDGVHGSELWKSSGTLASTTLVSSIWPGANGSHPQSLVNADGTLYFVAAANSNGAMLWRVANGTVEQVPQDGVLNPVPADPTGLILVGSRLYYTAALNGSSGQAVYVVETNLPAVAGNDTAVTNEDQSVTLTNVLRNDQGNATLIIASFDSTSAHGGNVVWNGNGSFTFTPAINFAGTDTFTYTIQDRDGDVAVGTVSIWVKPVNDAPLLDSSVLPSLIAISEDNRNTYGTPIGMLMAGISDADFGAQRGIAISGASGTASGLWQYTFDNGATWQSLGNVSASSARLLPVNGNQVRVRFIPNAEFNGAVSIQYAAWDQTQGAAGSLVDLSQLGATGGTTAYSGSSRPATLIVTAVNDAPKLNTSFQPSLASINEDNRASYGTPVWTLLSGVSDADQAAARGVAITAASTANGNWQITLDSGATWQALGDISAAAAKLLPANGNVSRLRFVPNQDFNGFVSLGYAAWDQTQGSAGGSFDVSQTGSRGGSNAFSINFNTASLTVNPVNDAPVLSVSSAPIGYAINSPPVLLASTSTLRDVDNSSFAGGWFKMQITSGADSADRLTIGGAFKIVDGNLIFNNTATIGTVQAGSASGSEPLLINLTAGATQYRVEQLLRSIKFGTAPGSTKTGPRSVSFIVNDGNASSQPAKVMVQAS